MKGKAIVFCPYFGKLPSHFNIWLQSCSYNPNIEFIVFSNDIVNVGVPENVLVEHISFDKFRSVIQSKFPFQIKLTSPYKLCDFKPTYGYIFSDRLTGYDYWGYCDLDLILGNIEKYIPNIEYDKISHLGHFCLYRNKKEITECFMQEIKGVLSYKVILSSNMHFGFDEIGSYGMNSRLLYNGYSIFPLEESAADIYCYTNNLSIVKCHNGKFTIDRTKCIFTFENGCIFKNYISDSGVKKLEYAYIHFQKRKMINDVEHQDNKYIITAHHISEYCAISSDYIKKNRERYLYPSAFRIKIKAGLHLVKRNMYILYKKQINNIIYKE